MTNGKMTIRYKCVTAANGKFVCGTVPTKSKLFVARLNILQTERKSKSIFARLLWMAKVLSNQKCLDAVRKLNNEHITERHKKFLRYFYVFIIHIYEGAINLKHFSTLQKQNRSTIGLRATVFVIYDRFAFAAR